MNIAITATGGGVGQSIIKSLRDSDYRLIALDSENLAAGLYMADKGLLIPYASSTNYIPSVLKICKDEKIDLLIPGMDCELKKLSINQDEFEKIGTKVIVSNPAVIDIADDKLLTQEFLKSHNLPYIKTTTNCETLSHCGKVVVKPRKGGARSKNTYKFDNESEININLNGYVIQEYIEGDEYTCGTVTLDDIYYGCIVMRRILRDGDTYKAFVERNKVIESLCETICKAIKPQGAFNIQLRMKNGVPYVFEFNSRCSGTTAARSLSGFNEPRMIADYLLKGIKPKHKIKEQSILRYWNELIVTKLI